MNRNRHLTYLSFLFLVFFSFSGAVALASNSLPIIVIDITKIDTTVASIVVENTLELNGETDILLPLLSDTTKCRKYKTEKRETVISSTRGQLTDTGWENMGEDSLNCEEGLPADNQNCTSVTIPGASLGDEDETITTCVYYRYTCIENCGECEASDDTQTFSVALPGWTPLKQAAAQAAKSMPMISDFSIDVTGNATRETGEKCCLNDKSQPPVTYEKWSGTLSASISLTLNIPGWHWSFVRDWQGLFRIRAIVQLGPTVTFAPSGTVSVTGTKYSTCEADCACCVTTSYTATIGLEVAFGGEVEALIRLYFWPHTQFSAGAYAKASLSSSLGSSGTYNWDICPNPGFSGEVSYGALTGTAQFGVKFKGYDISYSWAWTLLPGGSVSF